MTNSKKQTKYVFIILSVVLATFIGRLDANIVLISLPTISRFFNITAVDVSWIIIAFVLVQTSTLMLFGSMIDRAGVKRIFLAGYIIFTLSSLICGLSASFTTLLIARVVQALGAAMLLTSSLAIISKYVQPDKIGLTFGLASAAQAVGVAFGTGFGGLISGLSSWHWIFLVNVPIGIIAMFIAFLVIPNEDAKDLGAKKKKFDFIGAALSSLAVLLLVFGLNRVQEYGWTSLPTLLSFIAAIVLLALFILYEKSCANPLLDVKIFKNKQLSFMTITFFTVFLVGGFCILLPFYFESIKGFKPQGSGLVLMLYSILYLASSIFTGKASDKINPYILCLTAIILEIIAAVFFSFTFYYPGYLSLVIFLILFAIANGMFIAPNNKIIMSFATPETKGMISGVLNMLIGVSTVLGMAIYQAVYSKFIADSQFLAFKAIGVLSCFIFITAIFSCFIAWKSSSKETMAKIEETLAKS